MSHEQPQRPQPGNKFLQQEPIKYGDVFNVSGNLASKPITPKEAAMMQATENHALGTTQKGGPAAAMQSAAAFNVTAGLVNRNDISDVNVMETNKDGNNRVIKDAVMKSPGCVIDGEGVTIGEALEASALNRAGDKAVDMGDAAAIQAAEMRAITGKKESEGGGGGIGAIAQSAATKNTHSLPFMEKTTLSHVLMDVREKLPSDKTVTKEDAEGVIGAEIRNKPDMRTTPGGVAASVAAAARLNQNK